MRLRNCVFGKGRGNSPGIFTSRHRDFRSGRIYGLTSQCNRAAASVAANLAEGSSRRSRKDQAHFSEIAYGSLTELACLLILCNDIGILSADSERALRNSVEKVSLQLNALHRSQRAGAG